jgi:hypothetical protein
VLYAHVIGVMVMIVMIGWLCSVGWALLPCYRRDNYDRYDRLGI